METIASVDILPFTPRFSGDGYAMSFIVQKVLPNQLVRLTLSDGMTGVGENVRWFTYPLSEAEKMEAKAVPDLAGLALADLPGLLRDWRGRGKPLRGLAFGVETAYFDLLSQRSGVPLPALLGGPAQRALPEYLSLSSEPPAHMAAQVQQFGAGFPVIQAKLGVGDLTLDLERVRATLAAMQPHQMLLADFNGALSPDQALTGLAGLSDPRLMWEEPCARYDDNVIVARGLSAPVMFDQCLGDLPTYVRAIQDQAAAAIVIKPALLGGLDVARVACDMCVAADMNIRLDGPWCGQIGAAVALALTMGIPDENLICTIDLTDPIETERSLIHRPRPGLIELASPLPPFGPIFDAQAARVAAASA